MIAVFFLKKKQKDARAPDILKGCLHAALVANTLSQQAGELKGDTTDNYVRRYISELFKVLSFLLLIFFSLSESCA